MKRLVHVLSAAAALAAFSVTAPAARAQGELHGLKPGRDPHQPIDSAYTAKIREYTTEPFFSSPLVDYLPASKTVPTPMAELGDIAGRAGTTCRTRRRSTPTCACSPRPARACASGP